MSALLHENGSFPYMDFVSTSALSPNIKANGVVYTPSFLADFVAKKILSFSLANSSPRQRRSPLRVLDPACGNGELLLAISRQYREAQRNSSVFSQLSLFGTELDSNAALATYLRLKEQGHDDCQVASTNALLPFGKDRNSGWRALGTQWSVSDGFDAIIANPPWGADTSGYSKKLKSGGYVLSKGQFDTSDLFVELSLSLVKRGGFIAMIVPDSLFADERKELRKLLLSTEIKFIARLGEKIFKGVNRASAVVICQVRDKVDPKNEVTCLRLTPASRRALLNNQGTLSDVAERDSHKVPQRRFLDNIHNRFDIDNKVGCDIQLANDGFTFGTYLRSSRGVELSKSGKVCQCSSCNKWMPLPRSTMTCTHCGYNLGSSGVSPVTIIGAATSAEAIPIFVGEHVQRYRLSGKLWITPGFDGINYKSPRIYSGPKLLVRKTGVGISASIDYTDSLTNQVVYIFKLKDPAMALPLEFFLGILNSRFVYYHTAIRHGETEWRSHPYVTQGQLLNMPLPEKMRLFRDLPAVNEMSDIVRSTIMLGRPISHEADARIEYLVAKLFGMTSSDYQVIYRALDQLEGLLPVRQLRSVLINDIFG